MNAVKRTITIINTYLNFFIYSPLAHQHLPKPTPHPIIPHFSAGIKKDFPKPLRCDYRTCNCLPWVQQITGEKKYRHKESLFQEEMPWKDCCIGSVNAFIGKTDSANTSASPASSTRSASATEVLNEREVAICSLGKEIKMSG